MSTDVQVNFIRTELQTGFTMLRLAHTEHEIHDLAGATQAIANAHTALDSAKRFASLLKDAPASILDELRRGIEDLEGGIRQFECPSTRTTRPG